MSAAHGIKLRPHTKTHKSRMIARLQLDAGAVGLTVAKVGEAEEMAGASDDLLMAYPAVDRARCRAAGYARTYEDGARGDRLRGRPRVVGRGGGGGRGTIGLLVDLDVGMGSDRRGRIRTRPWHWPV